MVSHTKTTAPSGPDATHGLRAAVLKFSRHLERLPRPGLTAAAAIGALTWAFAVWIGPWIAPGPPGGAGYGDHEAAIDGNTSVLALTVPDGAQEARPHATTRTVTVRAGDTLIAALARARVGAEDAQAAVAALRKVFNPRALAAGTEISVTFQPLGRDRTAGESFRSLEFAPSIRETVGVGRTWDNRFEAYSDKAKLTREQTRASGRIDNSLYVDAVAAGVPAPIVVEAIRGLSYDVDFQRDIQPADRFDLLFEGLKNTEGALVGSGDLIYAALTLSGKRIEIYRFRDGDGNRDYFNGKGDSTRKTLMRTPIDGARLSSRFGNRRHPILGYTKVHKGIDFAAPTGTPIMAAGHGVVAEARWNGAYGRYVRIRHNSTYATAYAHMSRFANGIQRGARVRQGQTIGYVGTTGRSTGPHLHYEVLSNNRHVNPLSVKLPTGYTLQGNDRRRFLVAKKEIDDAFKALTPLVQAKRAQAPRKTGAARPGAGEELGIGGP